MFEIWDEDEGGTPPAKGWMEVAQAILFLTRIPLRIRDGSRLPPLAQAARAFPLAGALVGLIAGTAGALAFQLGLGALVSGSVGLAAAILVTGALHEDGLADTADGFWGGQTLQRKLAIMRDSRIGSYGVLALGLGLLLRAGLAGEILSAGGGLALLAGLAGAGAISRALIVPLMAHLPAARADGLSAHAGAPTKSVVRQALALGAAIGLIAIWAGAGLPAALLALALATAAAYGMAMLARHHIGGQTGDVCGALSVVAETAALAGIVIWL